MFKHLLICTDGSPLANKAAKGGIALAKALQAKVTAYSAIETLLPIYSEGYAFDQLTIDRFEAAIQTVAKKRVDAIGKLAKAAGVPVACVVTIAYSPREGIIAAAKKQKCDAIVIASHGRSGISKLFMGSVDDHPRAGVACSSALAPAGSTRYTCSMHPEIVRDAPGKCPKCGMTLVPL